jgi:hypothetical protein
MCYQTLQRKVTHQKEMAHADFTQRGNSNMRGGIQFSSNIVFYYFTSGGILHE